MPLTIVTTQNYEQYSEQIDQFARAVPARADYSEERAGGPDRTNLAFKRCMAYRDGTIVGWTVLKLRDGDLRVEGICTHTDVEMKKGVAKALLLHAFNMAIRHGKGQMTLFDASHGAGGGIYGAFGFEPVDGHGEMRLDIAPEARPGPR